jgi:hypothetical protein
MLSVNKSLRYDFDKVKRHGNPCKVNFLAANGTAVEGVNVTRRKHRAGPGTLARKLSRCKEGMARVFASR